MGEILQFQKELVNLHRHEAEDTSKRHLVAGGTTVAVVAHHALARTHQLYQ
jgi:hypothetical protein